MLRPPPNSTLFPYTTLFRSGELFTTLSKTKLVSVPTRKFDAKAGKPGATDAEQQAPAGLTMVKDVLWAGSNFRRSEEHTSELQSRQYLVCRLLLEKKKKKEE